MLFQGQEYGSTRPFLYFADHEEGLASLIREGRQQFLSQFERSVDAEVRARDARRSPRDAFEASKLVHDEGARARAWSALHRDLIRLRREDPVFAARQARPEGATLNDRVLLLRDHTEAEDDRLLVVNLGVDFDLARAPDPLAAPPALGQWRILWSSEALRYGGWCLGSRRWCLHRK
jgi:maltooligosyltrehalose trehalohydrolase